MSQDTARGRLTLEEIVDLCLDDLLMETATLEDCLDRYPEHREALEPILRTAMAFGELPVAQVQPDPARRAAFMTTLSETPQERPGLRLPSIRRTTGNSPWASLWRGAVLGVPAAALALVALLVVTTSNPSTASAATLTVFTGQVERQVDGEWIAAIDGASMPEGTVLRTGLASRALVTFPDGSTATVDASTEVTLRRIAVGTTRTIEIDQASGRIWNDVVPVGSGDSYVVQTPHALVSAHGTVFETFVNGVTAVRADDGLVRLTARGESVEVGPGQRASATADSLVAATEATVTAQISVDAPAVAYLAAADGAATGALSNGVVFRQLPGVSTDSPADGSGQQFTFGDVSPGRYSLVVERISEGDGEVVIDTPAGRLVMPVPAGSGISSVQVDVVEENGERTVRAVEPEVRTVERVDAPGVRISEAARSRPGIDVAALAAARRGNDPTTTAAAIETPETATATVTAPTETPRPDEGDERDEPERPSGRPWFWPWQSRDRDEEPDRNDERPNNADERPTASASPTETPSPAPTATPAVTPTPEATPSPTPTSEVTPTPEATPTPGVTPTAERAFPERARGWARSVEEALRIGDDRGLGSLLRDTLDGNRRTDEARLTALLMILEDPSAQQRIAEVLASDRNRRAADEIRRALDGVRPGAGELLQQPIVTVTPTPTPTATPTLTPTPTATAVSTPAAPTPAPTATSPSGRPGGRGPGDNADNNDRRPRAPGLLPFLRSLAEQAESARSNR